MDAKTIVLAENNCISDCEIYYARSVQDTWPGWAAPLGKRGYWYGTSENHKHIGTSYKDVQDYLVSFQGILQKPTKNNYGQII